MIIVWLLRVAHTDIFFSKEQLEPMMMRQYRRCYEETTMAMEMLIVVETTTLETKMVLCVLVGEAIPGSNKLARAGKREPSSYSDHGGPSHGTTLPSTCFNAVGRLLHDVARRFPLRTRLLAGRRSLWASF
jgi:hypothetical protein